MDDDTLSERLDRLETTSREGHQMIRAEINVLKAMVSGVEAKQDVAMMDDPERKQGVEDLITQVSDELGEDAPDTD